MSSQCSGVIPAGLECIEKCRQIVSLEVGVKAYCTLHIEGDKLYEIAQALGFGVVPSK